MTRLIGTPAGWSALRSWAEIAPAGWGAALAVDLRNAVQLGMCIPGVAAALIGPDDRSASLLRTPQDIAFAVRHWGRFDSVSPTAWMGSLSADERQRLIDTGQRTLSDAASCLPWLPSEAAHVLNGMDGFISYALGAFAEASPITHAQHAAFLQDAIARAHPVDLETLTSLACATGSKAVWRRVQTLIQASPDDAWRVVAAAPWSALSEEVQRAILDRADHSPVGAAIAAARSDGKPMKPSPLPTGIAFFAALDPRVWDTLDAATQRWWFRSMQNYAASLAVRSIGLRPEVLARAGLGNDLVRTAQRHIRDAATLRRMIFPIALREVARSDASMLIATMSPPPDAGAFFVIASGHADPDVLAPARAALRTPADLACAVVMQRSADDDPDESIRDRCDALQHALCGRTWDNLPPLLALLSDDVRTALMPDADALVGSLARPERQDALRRTRDRLAALPPEVAVPTLLALTQWRPWNADDAAAAAANALRTHSSVFLGLANAMANADPRAELLPLPEDAALADALRALARDDPPTACRLAHALRDGDWKDVIRLAPSLPQWAQNAVTPHADDLVARLARPDGSDKMRAALQQLASAPPDVDIPARCALARLSAHRADDSQDAAERQEAAEALTHALRAHGDVFLAMMDALADDERRTELLPLPKDAALADALRTLAKDDPPTAHWLAHALCSRSWSDALAAFLRTSLEHASDVWSALDNDAQRKIVDVIAVSLLDVDPHIIRDPIAALALAAVQSDDANLQEAGRAALTARPGIVRAIWEQLPSAVRQVLVARPACADLSPPARSAIQRGRRC